MISAPFQCRAAKDAACLLFSAAFLAAAAVVLAVLAAPCAVWPAALAALAYSRLMCCFCQKRETGFLATCASSGLFRMDF